MQTWDAIRARRNVRSYRTTPVPDADLNRIAEAAWRAPSAPTDVTTVTPVAKCPIASRNSAAGTCGPASGRRHISTVLFPAPPLGAYLSWSQPVYCQASPSRIWGKRARGE